MLQKPKGLMDPEVVERSASELSRSQVSAFFAEVVGGPWVGAREGPYSGAGRAAFVAGELVGLLVGNGMLSNENPEDRILVLSGGVHPEWRRRGIGRRLLAAFLAECRPQAGRTAAYVTLHGLADTEGSAVPFLVKCGFKESSSLLRYERDLTAFPPDWPEVEGEIVATRYGGGDAAIDAAIVNLYTRAYRGRDAIALMSPEALQRLVTNPASTYFVAHDGKLLVGYASTYDGGAECVVGSLAVARSHWRTGASDCLARATIRHAASRSLSKIVGYVEGGNHASRAMVERHGLKQTSRTLRYSRVLDPR
jgi:ribosomal protein S18 acetylase RimI-like enzyme